MTGTQYKNVAQWTLANGAAEASDSAAAAKAIFDNMGVLRGDPADPDE